MADPHVNGNPSSSIPASIDVSRATKPDQFHPIPINHSSEAAAAAQEESRIQNDYTDNASPFEIAAVVRERKATENMGDFMVGSLTDWDSDGNKGSLGLSH